MIKSGTLSKNLLLCSEALFYCLLAYTPFAYGAVEVTTQALAHFLAYAVVLSFIVGSMLSGRWTFTIPVISILIGLFLAWGWVSATWLMSYEHPARSYLLLLIDYLLISFYVVNHFSRSKRFNRLFTVITVLGAAVAAHGLFSYVSTSPAAGADGFRFATGPYVNHNHFAGFLAMAFAAGLGFFLSQYRKSRPEFIILLGSCVLIILFGLLFSLSRGAIVSTLIAASFLCLVFALRSGSRRVLAPLVVLGAIVLGYLTILETKGLENRLMSLGDQETLKEMNSRIPAWKSALRAGLDEPIIGHGMGSYSVVLPNYREEGSRFGYQYAHNDYLQAWAETGLVGLLIISLGLVLYFFRLRMVLSRSIFSREMMVLGAGAGIMAMLVHSTVDFNLHLHANALMFVTLLALFSPASEKPAGISLSLAACAILLLLIYPGLIYSFQDWRADRLNQKGDSEMETAPLQATQHYRQAASLIPRNADYHYKLGNAYSATADLSETAFYRSLAAESYAMAITLNPLDIKSWLGLGFVYSKLGFTDHADSCFTMAVRQDPANPSCYFYLSDYYLKTERLELAVQSSAEGLSLVPEYFTFRLRKISEHTDDLSLLERLIPENYMLGHYELGIHLFNLKYYESALRQFDLCDEKIRNGKEYYRLRGSCYLALDQKVQAERCFRQGIEKRPPETGNFSLLAILLDSQGRSEEVADLFDQWLMTAPAGVKSEVHYQYALYLKHTGDYLAQRKQAQKALERNVNNPAYLELLADSYLGENRYYEALKELRRVETLAPGRVSAIRKIAETYVRLGQSRYAADYCLLLLEVKPNDRYALDMLARIQGDSIRVDINAGI